MDMIWSNYHGHCNYCDGKGKMEDYVKEALNLGMKSMGFSSHVPLPFECPWSMRKEHLPNYIKEVRSLKKKYEDRIQLYVGLEVDYVPDIMGPQHEDILNLSLDYNIGSVHFVDQFPDGTPFEVDGMRREFVDAIDQIFLGDSKKLVCRYFELIREMLTKSKPTILGHLDKLKVHNVNGVLFDESAGWYKDEVVHTMDVLASNDVILEVSTRGIYKKICNETYPSPWILKQALEREIPVIISSDAHHIREINGNFDLAMSTLLDVGYKEVWQLWNGNWKQFPIN